MKTYNTNNIGKIDLSIDGYGTDKLWHRAVVLDDFLSPWDHNVPGKIEFKALWNAKKLFFQFKVEDNSIHIDHTDDSFDSIGKSDRVELFFRKDKNLNPYYCLEIDPTSRIMDFRAFPNKYFEFDWDFSKNDLFVKSSINEKGFLVEGSINLSYLKKLDLINGNKIEVGVFRAKYNKSKNSIYEPIWISWCRPESETPDFHIPSSFGILYLK